jgi:hypothetical protein
LRIIQGRVLFAYGKCSSLRFSTEKGVPLYTITQDVCCLSSTVYSINSTDSIEGGPPALVCVTIIDLYAWGPRLALQDDTGK